MRNLKAPDDSNLCHHCGPCAAWSQVRTAVGKAGGARGKFQEQQEQKTVVFQFLTSTEASDFCTGLWSSTAQWEWILPRALTKWWVCNRMWSLPALPVSLSQQSFPVRVALPALQNHCQCPTPPCLKESSKGNSSSDQSVLTVAALQVRSHGLKCSL